MGENVLSTIMEIAFSAIRISTPLIFAALGGLLTYQAGILNIALDGFMIVAAFAGSASPFATGSLLLGVIAGILAAVVLAALLATFNLKFRADIFIAGIAVTFLAYGLTALLLKGVSARKAYSPSDRIPTFPTIHIPARRATFRSSGRWSADTPFSSIVAYLSVPVVSYFLYRTRWGLRVRVVGEAAGRGGDCRRQCRPAEVRDHALVGLLLRPRWCLPLARATSRCSPSR